MAMLRVSSYRRLYEDGSWGRNGGLGTRCAGQYRASVRGAAVDECHCDEFDFVAAETLNKEGLSRFVQDRTAIAALNDRLVRIIELARWFEEENESLECQIVELEEKLSGGQASSRLASTAAPPAYSLDAVVERLRQEKEDILCDTEELQKELEVVQKSYEKAAQQRILHEQERHEVAEEVDAVTAECLALRERVAIYEEQLANAEARHEAEVESLLDPAEGTAGAFAALGYSVPDVTRALDVKEYYCQLAESLQCECGAASSAVAHVGGGNQRGVGEAVGPMVTGSLIKDADDTKTLISELQKELAELEKWNAELEDEVETKRDAQVEEIAELKFTIDELRHQEADFRGQMKEQCGHYKELLSEKMAREMEIVAYRSLVEEENERLRNL